MTRISSAVCKSILINGVDKARRNLLRQITRFKAMVRPLVSVNKLHDLMGRMLQAAQQQ